MEWKRSTYCAANSCVEVADWRRSSWCTDNACVEVCSSSNCVEVAWETSSYCANGSCVQVGRRTATASGGNGCVEVECKCHDGRVYVRDSKLGDESPIITFTTTGWLVFLDMAARWDRTEPLAMTEARLVHHPMAEYPVCLSAPDSSGGRIHLHYSPDEWDAFVKGVEAGEFPIEVAA